MREVATRRLPLVLETEWMKFLPPAMRFILHGEARARRIAAGVWGATFAEEACRAVVNETRATLWLGPDEYLLLGTPLGAPSSTPSGGDDAGLDISAALEHALGSVPHALVNISHRQFAFEVIGPHAATILSGGCPLDLDIRGFPVGMCTRTALAKADIVLWRKRYDVFHLEVWRSFCSYATGLLGEIAMEFYGNGAE